MAHVKKNKQEGAVSYNIPYELNVEGWQEPILEKIFGTYNTLKEDFIKYVLRLVHEVENTKIFKEEVLEKEQLHAQPYKDIKLRVEFFKNYTIKMNTPKGGLKDVAIFNGSYGLGNLIPLFVKTYKNCIYVDSISLQYISDNVWKGLEKYLISEPKCNYINTKREVNSIKCRKKNDRFGFLSYNKEKGTIDVHYKKHKFVSFPMLIGDSLRQFSLNNEITAITIKREMIRGKYRYYAVLTFYGNKPINQNYKLGNGTMGIDPSQTCIHYVTDEEIGTVAIGDKDIISYYDNKIAKLKRKLERSRRATNPDNYNEDGTIIKHKNGTKLIWKYSNNYIKIRNRLKELHRKRADILKKHQYEVANSLLEKCDTVKYESNSYKAFAKRANGVRKNKSGKILSNKRFGKTIGSYAPSQFKTILAQKVKERRGDFIEVPSSAACTQYDFTVQDFIPHELKERTITLSNGDTFNRDIISAFNIQHYIGGEKVKTKSSSYFNNDLMKENYEQFVTIAKI